MKPQITDRAIVCPTRLLMATNLFIYSEVKAGSHQSPHQTMVSVDWFRMS